MASALYNCAVYLGQSACGMIFGVSDPFKIKVSPGCLKQAIQDKGKDVLQCKFEDAFLTYSPLEYAVKTWNKESARILIKFGAKVEDSPLSFGTMLHFYIENLTEGNAPDLEMLNLLLDHSPDVNEDEMSGYHTVLEWALMHMKSYENIRPLA